MPGAFWGSEAHQLAEQTPTLTLWPQCGAEDWGMPLMENQFRYGRGYGVACWVGATQGKIVRGCKRHSSGEERGSLSGPWSVSSAAWARRETWQLVC